MRPNPPRASVDSEARGLRSEAGPNEHAQRAGFPRGETHLSRACPPWRSEPIYPARGDNGTSSGHGFNRAVQPSLPERLSFARLTRAKYSISCSEFLSRSGIMSTWNAKLDFYLSPAKSTTSKFLIDNFCTLSRSHPSESTIVKSPCAFHSPLACPEWSGRVTRHSFTLRHEGFTLTKEGPLPSNRPYFAVCKTAVLRTFIPSSQLSTLDCQLRAANV